MAIEACRIAGIPLVIAGEGPELDALAAGASGADVRFLGRVEGGRARGAAGESGRDRARAVAVGRDVRDRRRRGDGGRPAGGRQRRGGARRAARPRGAGRAGRSQGPGRGDRPAGGGPGGRRAGPGPRRRSCARPRLSGRAFGRSTRRSRPRATRPGRRAPQRAIPRKLGACPPPRTALITGITGQDGSFLAELLLEKGYEVTGWSRAAATVRWGQPSTCASGCPCVEGELLDPESLRAAIARAAPARALPPRRALVRARLVGGPGADHAGDRRVTAARPRGGARPRRRRRACSWPHPGRSSVRRRRARRTSSRRAGPTNPYAIAKLAGAPARRGDARTATASHASSGIVFNHESERRPEQFVTRRITRGAAAIALGPGERAVTLGSLEAVRDWSFAGDIDARRLADAPAGRTPGDYVLASGVGAHRRGAGAARPSRASSSTPSATCAWTTTLVREPERTPSVGDPSTRQARARVGAEVDVRGSSSSGWSRADLRSLAGGRAQPLSVPASPYTGPVAHDRCHRPGLRRPAASGGVRPRGLRGGRRRRRRAQDRGDRGAAAPTSRTCPIEELAEVLRAPARWARRYAPLAEADAVLICVPTPLSRNREPDLGPLVEAARALAGVLRRGPARRARVDDLPGHDARAAAAAARGVRAVGRPRLPPRLLAGAGGPWPHRLHDAQHARRSSAVSRRTAPSARAELYEIVCDEIVARLDPRGGRADEAARERLPLGQHRARQRARDAHRPHGDRRLGGRRRGRDQALRVHALRARARAWAATACRSIPST